MGNRSNFERREADFYPTPWAAVLPLIPYLRGTLTEAAELTKMVQAFAKIIETAEFEERVRKLEEAIGA